MATKRKIVTSEKGRESLEEEERREKEEARKAKGPTLREWWRNTYAKYWFVIVAMAVDAFGALQISSSIEGDLGSIAALIVLAVLVIIEILIYRALWPSREEDD